MVYGIKLTGDQADAACGGPSRRAQIEKLTQGSEAADKAGLLERNVRNQLLGRAGLSLLFEAGDIVQHIDEEPYPEQRKDPMYQAPAEVVEVSEDGRPTLEIEGELDRVPFPLDLVIVG